MNDVAKLFRKLVSMGFVLNYDGGTEHLYFNHDKLTVSVYFGSSIDLLSTNDLGDVENRNFQLSEVEEVIPFVVSLKEKNGVL